MKISLSENDYKTFLVEVNRIIEEEASEYAKELISGKYTVYYPPNGNLTSSEKKRLKELKLNKDDFLLLTKMFASNSSSAFFHVFNLIDWTGDPETAKWDGDGIMLISKPKDHDEDYDFLHDGLFEHYWDWKKLRKSDYTLDDFNDN